MASYTRPRIKGLDPKGLCGSSIHYLPDINPHPVTEQHYFIDQCNIDSSVCVFKNLGHLSNRWAGNRHHIDNCLFVKGNSHIKAGRGHTTDNLGCVFCGIALITRVHSLRRESKEEVLTHFQSAFLQNRQDNIFCSPRIGSALQSHQMPSPQPWRYFIAYISDI